MSDVRQLRRLRWGVRAVLTLGVAASVSANVLHAYPNPISQTIAAWPPVALLLTVELISRVPVHRRALAFARIAATVAIAGIAAWVSYWHMAAVAARYGETTTSAYLLPLSVDGLIVVASVCLVELGGRLATARPAPNSAAVVLAGHPLAFLPADAAALAAQASAATPATASPAPVAAPAVTTPDQPPSDVPAGVSPVAPAGTRPVRRDAATAPPVYQPSSDEDAAMYAAWQRGIAAGREPSGVDLARAAGRSNDATGAGRRAARRYRDAHAQAAPSAQGRAPDPHQPPQQRSAGAVPAGTAAGPETMPAAWRHNGHQLTATGAAS